MIETSEIKWDLSIIFKDNEEAKAFIKINEKYITNLRKELKGHINRDNIHANEVYKFLEKLNKLSAKIEGIFYFARNQLYADQTIKESLVLMNTASDLYMKGKMIVASFEIELGQLLLKRAQLINEPQLKSYKHYLEKLVRKTQYMLSENEEQLILEKDRYGSNGWTKLQSEWLSSRQFKIIDEGVEKTVTWGEFGKYSRAPNRETRKNALINMVGENGLAKDKELFAATLRNICGDHVLTSKRRDQPTTFTSSLITNDITQIMIDHLLEVVKENANLYQDFLLLKAKIMSTEKLLGEDLWVPIPILPEKFKLFNWENAKEIVLKVFNEFDEEFGSIARKMFDENHIDASPRKGKRAGAYCSTIEFMKEAFILMSFTESLADVGTLAHEMGHAVHSYLSIKQQKFLNNSVSFCVAETASEFGRFLLVDNIRRNTDDEIVKKFILFNHLETLATIIFEVGSRTSFEKSLYDAIEVGEYLDADKISELFVKARKQFFGDAIEFLPEQRFDWTWKPHYYRIDLRYYNYPYYFAELLVMSLYNRYKKEGNSFVPKFKRFLACGGSKSPLELGKEMGVNLEAKEFWQMGLNEFKAILEETKKLFQ